MLYLRLMIHIYHLELKALYKDSGSKKVKWDKIILLHISVQLSINRHRLKTNIFPRSKILNYVGRYVLIVLYAPITNYQTSLL